MESLKKMSVSKLLKSIPTDMYPDLLEALLEQTKGTLDWSEMCEVALTECNVKSIDVSDIFDYVCMSIPSHKIGKTKSRQTDFFEEFILGLIHSNTLVEITEMESQIIFYGNYLKTTMLPEEIQAEYDGGGNLVLDIFFEGDLNYEVYSAFEKVGINPNKYVCVGALGLSSAQEVIHSLWHGRTDMSLLTTIKEGEFEIEDSEGEIRTESYLILDLY